jgi:hypothetical protein
MPRKTTPAACLVVLLTACNATPPAAQTSPSGPSAIPSNDPVAQPMTLNVNLKSDCPEIPEIVRTRTYAAQFDLRSVNTYVVTLSGALFFEDEPIPGGGAIVHCGNRLGCNQFLAWREGDAFRFELAGTPLDADGEFFTGGGMIVERIPPDDRLTISGTGTGLLETTGINASLIGDVSYCPSVSNPPRVRSWGCVHCAGSQLRLTFTRK